MVDKASFALVCVERREALIGGPRRLDLTDSAILSEDQQRGILADEECSISTKVTAQNASSHYIVHGEAVSAFE